MTNNNMDNGPGIILQQPFILQPSPVFYQEKTATG